MNDKLRHDMEIYKGTNDGFRVRFCLKGKPYKMQPEDQLILEVRDYRNDNNVVISKTIPGSDYFGFAPADTAELSVGYYIYNIKFIESATGFVYEIISPSTFWIKAGE